ncbi:MAG: HD domain-containing phosphohydrolase [Acidimicrobiales bacterium]
MTTITIVERAGRRLLPLSTLLRLSLVFPDRTPSRFKMALKAGSGKRMEREVLEVRTNGLSTDRAQAAEQLVLLSTAIGAHDRRTRGHSERVRLYAELLGEELHLSTEERQKLQWAALIHDMGKITVPPAILNKKGKPDGAEWAILQNHPAAGADLVAPVSDWLGEWVHAVGGHHERWDGTGYPLRLGGPEIPRAAAMVAVADSFEVMTAIRSYKSAMSLADARAELTRCSGTHFSPDMVRAFLNISLPKLRRAGGALASLAHVPFLGNALTASAKAPEAWGYGITTLANTGGSAMATVAVTGLLMTAPVSAASHKPDAPVAAAAIEMEQPSAPSALALRQEGAVSPSASGDVDQPSLTGSPTTTIEQQRTGGAEVSSTGGQTGTGAPTIVTPPSTTLPAAASPVASAPPTSQAPTNPAPTVPTTSPPSTAPTSTINTIDGLIAVLAPNPDAYGERGSDLLSKLRDLQKERAKHPDTDHHVTDRARGLIDDVDKWLTEGKLDAAIGADAIRLLQPLAG